MISIKTGGERESRMTQDPLVKSSWVGNEHGFSFRSSEEIT